MQRSNSFVTLHRVGHVNVSQFQFKIMELQSKTFAEPKFFLETISQLHQHWPISCSYVQSRASIEIFCISFLRGKLTRFTAELTASSRCETCTAQMAQAGTPLLPAARHSLAEERVRSSWASRERRREWQRRKTATRPMETTARRSSCMGKNTRFGLANKKSRSIGQSHATEEEGPDSHLMEDSNVHGRS